MLKEELKMFLLLEKNVGFTDKHIVFHAECSTLLWRRTERASVFSDLPAASATQTRQQSERQSRERHASWSYTQLTYMEEPGIVGKHSSHCAVMGLAGISQLMFAFPGVMTGLKSGLAGSGQMF